MAFDLSTTVTGVVLGGLTAPTYILTADTAPLINARQSIVTSLGGTQTGVRTHSPSDPFSVTVIKPLRALGLPRANPITGSIGPAGRNKNSIKFRKGTLPLVGQNPQVSEITIDAFIVAGAEINDKPNLAALWSMAAAFCSREAANAYAANTTGNI